MEGPQPVNIEVVPAVRISPPIKAPSPIPRPRLYDPGATSIAAVVYLSYQELMSTVIISRA